MKHRVVKFGADIRRFTQLEAAGGLLLLLAAVCAILLRNSPLGDGYSQLLSLVGEVRIGSIGLEKPLLLWINDGLMAVFFFLVSLEIKREITDGHLSDRSRLVLPAIAAMGGMLVPALIYVMVTFKYPEYRGGWAIPTATDIAFAMGVLSLLGNRVPLALKVFLMTLAVLDDLGAILVIAFFYTSELSFHSLWLATLACAFLIFLNRTGVSRVAPYIVTGIVLWTFVLESGVHATLAGVITGLAIPGRSKSDTKASPLSHIVHELHPWVAFGILPLFAFANAGVLFDSFSAEKILAPVPLGILMGFVIGKPLGVYLFSTLAINAGVAQLPAGIGRTHLLGISVLCGIGFTMSLFIGGLALNDAALGYVRADRLAIIIASVWSGVLGYAILYKASGRVVDSGVVSAQ